MSESSSIGFGHPFTQSSDSCIEETSHSQKPAINSFDSANGPSVTVTANHFGIMQVHNLQQTMQNKGVQLIEHRH